MLFLGCTEFIYMTKSGIYEEFLKMPSFHFFLFLAFLFVHSFTKPFFHFWSSFVNFVNYHLHYIFSLQLCLSNMPLQVKLLTEGVTVWNMEILLICVKSAFSL